MENSMNTFSNMYSGIQVVSMVRRATFPEWKIPLRYITNMELVLILRGIGKISVEDEEVTVEGGDLLCFLPP